jgi:hypothetical protein
LGDRECPSQNPFYGLKTNFLFHWLFLDLLLSGTDLEKERESLRRGKKKKPCALKLGSAHIAFVVWYNPSPGI